jgi:hypothetical protein
MEKRFPSMVYVGRLSDSELVKEVRSWAIFLNPIWWYARGASMKLGQGINWGLPILSTAPGNRGYEWKDGDVETVTTPEDMAREIHHRTQDERSIRQMAEQTRRIADSGPTYEELAERIAPYL